ncbi:hypothetical protein AJ78_00602 [Emergomyces pasteurianus Ep9510]|uniref:RING-type domain-containing protein n=1 Tax=Emergomyces pasteurianus Ep9510 TaxID=1447872 RepID=A0A1J9QU76_9EURO|nr:hypothetical protein AJ78_00602 [Emergomyces pasteurianus Ep9510]
MGCSNSTQAGVESDGDKTVVKSLDSLQASTPSTNSTLFDDELEEEKEFDVAMMELTNEIFATPYSARERRLDQIKGLVVGKCFVCVELFTDKKLLHSACKTCPNFICNDCLRRMFISACRDESQMPPRCCGPLNVGAAVSVLSAEELQLFKNKHEEWATANRVYCPIPTCSAFIPYRLFPFEYRPTYTKLPKLKMQEVLSAPLPPTQPLTPPPTAPISASLSPPEPESIPCPGCSIEICCACKQVAHKGASCPEGAGELDPELAALLEKWKIKRCPKCRGAVRLMFGCNHVACRCGDQWCWLCMQPIEVCQSHGCTYEGTSDDEEGNESDWDEDADTENHIATRDDEARDLDRGGDRRWNNGVYEFNSEPDIENHDPIDCCHDWIKATTDDVNKGQKYVCERCWRDIFPRPYTYPEVVELMDHGFIPEKSITDGEDHGTPQLRLLICTRCSITHCDDCRNDDTATRVLGGRNTREN